MSSDLENIIYNSYFKNEDKRLIYKLIEELVKKDYQSNADLLKEIRKICRGQQKLPGKALISTCYQELKKQNKITPNISLEKFIRHKNIRSQSGVLVITIVMKPDKFSCPFDCYMCPDERIENGAEVDMPRSYLSTEPAEMRAMEVDFDTVKQFRSRMIMLEKNGHQPDKAEIIVLGGTFSTYPRDYQQEFIRDIYYAANTYFDQNERGRLTIPEEQAINETSRCHIVGLTLETRPDQINKEELERFRYYGCTRVQIGVQHTNNDILKIINRKHKVEHSIKAVKQLKEAGFKVDIHIMPDLPGTTPELDKEMMDIVFKTDKLQADYLKIYPCLDVKYTKIREWKQTGEWEPYAEQDKGEKLIDVILHAKRLIPRWLRVNRVQRDFPESCKENNYVGYESNNIRTNLRQFVLKKLEDEGLSCKCIRCREIKSNETDLSKAIRDIESYKSSDGTEYFISYNTPDMKYLYGFIRLRFNNPSSNIHFKFLEQTALIRELHVYGDVKKVNENKLIDDRVQHVGFGKKLIKHAENIAIQNGYNRIAIISAVGTRDYYRKLGYHLENTYMVKEFKNKINYLGLSIFIVLITILLIVTLSFLS